MYYCFGCGAGGNVYNFIMEYENYSFGEALSHLADRAGVELPKIEYSREAREKAEQRANLLEINKLAAQYFYYQLRREGGKGGLQISDRRGLSRKPSVNSVLDIRTSTVMICTNILRVRATVMSFSGNPPVQCR